MADFVVYEDTPIADYLKCIEGGETNVKPAPLHLGIHHSNMTPKTSATAQLSESLYRYWRRSLFHDTFSVSLPVKEESAFEEKFKYLIVTSPLLNDTLSTHPKQKQQQQQQQQRSSPAAPPFHSAAAHTRSARIGTMTTLSALLAALGLERILPLKHHQQQQQHSTTLALKGITTPTITMMLAGGVSLYFIYRHLRRSSIRKLYQCALTQLQDLLEQSQILDSKVHRALMTIQEIELVSRGYRLSTPLSPISRIEQSSKPKRCARLRKELSGLLRHAFIVYEETIVDMMDRVNKPTLSRLFDMYNIHSVASLSAVSIPATTPIPTKNTHDDLLDNDDSITLDYLKTLAHLMHLKRRECMLQFLALSVMTGNHDSMRKGYESGWRNVNTILVALGNETKGFVKTVKDAMEAEFCQSSTLGMDKSGLETSSTSTETRHFIRQLSTLDQHLRTMEARVYLCHDELQRRQRILLSTKTHRSDKDYIMELEQQTLKKEYMAMEKDIQQLVNEWETGRNALNALMTPPMIDTTDIIPLPSPTMTPTTTHTDDDDPPFVVTSDESSDLFHLPLPSKASVYESLPCQDDNSQQPVSNDKKKSRSERIAEMKLKRELEAKEKSSRMDSQTMVHELKDVLDRRILELDLANEE
ncbi:Mysoin-binding motif of peroxisomes-domain-containing protein [Chlamydoabsidia padenii]|nr:Mysoin-binding motif of peroxisomes-domain-containing protein [Chlamydoabsidia padenii]